MFDIRFWQSQGDIAIFEAAAEMLNDYFLIRGKNVDESRFQRTIEAFRKEYFVPPTPHPLTPSRKGRGNFPFRKGVGSLDIYSPYPCGRGSGGGGVGEWKLPYILVKN